MAFPIIPKRRSGATGNPTSLELGELATNTATGELFLGGDGGVMLLNPPTSAGTTVTEHTGDGSTVAFTFTGYNGTGDGGYLVSVGGIDQPPSKYSITNTNGGTITFVEAPVAGELISIRAIVAGSGGGGSGDATSLQGVAISATAPTDGQLLKYNGTSNEWEPGWGVYAVEYLLVAGGGSGGGGGGGGGAGGLLFGTTQVASGGAYPIVIGAGGANVTGTIAGNNGSLSSALGFTAIGGGSSGAYLASGSVNGLPGGSGGGCGMSANGTNHVGGAGTTGQGFAGGSNALSANAGGYVSGGGGGAAAVGAGRVNQTTSGAGGAGFLSAINGTALYWAGGGGGGGQSAGAGGLTGGNGGIGGGGGGAAAGSQGTRTGGSGGGSALNSGQSGDSGGSNGGAGGANTGGGGGGNGGSIGTTGQGGSGILILRYEGAQRGSGGTVTSAGGYTIHTFTTSGTFTA